MQADRRRGSASTPGEIRWTGQPLGADTDAVLTELLGLTTEQMGTLREQRVIGGRQGGEAGGASERRDGGGLDERRRGRPAPTRSWPTSRSSGT